MSKSSPDSIQTPPRGVADRDLSRPDIVDLPRRASRPLVPAMPSGQRTG